MEFRDESLFSLSRYDAVSTVVIKLCQCNANILIHEPTLLCILCTYKVVNTKLVHLVHSWWTNIYCVY